MMSRVALQELRLVAILVATAGAFACSGARGPDATATVPPVAHTVAPAASPAGVTYRVRPGDSLSRLAACSGVSVAELAKSNQISDPDLVFVGERLQLPRGHRCTTARPPARVATRSATREGDTATSTRARANGQLATANARLDAADFEASLSDAEACLHTLDSAAGDDAKANEIRARCHFVAGMAAAGLDRREHAIEEFRRAFALDPDLELPLERASPRILELVSAARPSPSP